MAQILETYMVLHINIQTMPQVEIWQVVIRWCGLKMDDEQQPWVQIYGRAEHILLIVLLLSDLMHGLSETGFVKIQLTDEKYKIQV